ncbi:hypothetical protein HRR90_003244 [Exophiala dermatitidis]|nr:hypothetical protein HRR90_003244 [Exophiala dermatitidis]
MAEKHAGLSVVCIRCGAGKHQTATVRDMKSHPQRIQTRLSLKDDIQVANIDNANIVMQARGEKGAAYGFRHVKKEFTTKGARWEESILISQRILKTMTTTMRIPEVFASHRGLNRGPGGSSDARTPMHIQEIRHKLSIMSSAMNIFNSLRRDTTSVGIPLNKGLHCRMLETRRCQLIIEVSIPSRRTRTHTIKERTTDCDPGLSREAASAAEKMISTMVILVRVDTGGVWYMRPARLQLVPRR